MRTLQKATVIGALTVPLLSLSAVGQVFQDNFDSGLSGAAWTTRLSHADASANFAFDYGSLGIPSAPKSIGGTTVGVRFLANQSGAVQQGVSASPSGRSFTGDFTVRFDMWLNYNGPLNGGGNGSTQVGSFGWGAGGATAEWAGASSSIMFGATGDGGSTFDYRVYRNNALLAPADGVYAAGTTLTPDVRNSSDPYYAAFGGKSAPAAQLTLFPQQANTSNPGAFGFAWRDVVVQKSGDVLTWTVDGTQIASVSAAGATLSGNNIFLGTFDINATSSTDPNDFLITAIFDNVSVVVPIPEPSTFLLTGLGLLGALALRRRR